MRSWSSYASWVVAAVSAGTVAYGCGQQSFGNCSDNGTCPGDGGDDALADTSVGAGEGGDEGRTGLDASEASASQETSDDAPSTDSADAPTDAPADSVADTWDGYDGFTCDAAKLPSQDSCVIAETLGVFVAPPASGGSDTVDGGVGGTREHPYATIGYALGHLNGTSRVYVCNATYGESVSMTFSTFASLFGGLACPGSDAGAPWSYGVGGAAHVNAGAGGGYALHVAGVTTPVVVQDMAFTAADATGVDANGNGNSSIAAFVSSSTVSFARVTFTAGAGAKGTDGTTGTNYSGATAQGGSAGYSPAGSGNGSGAGGSATCTGYGSSTGGAGGVAGGPSIWGGAGSPGASTPAATASGLRDGAGGPAQGASNNCGIGDDGADGTAGSPGAAATALGSLASTGWTPSNGNAGNPGSPGQGGGGGGGGGMSSPAFGGDGGGSGGCGGSGGAGGKGGGASVALVSVDSTIAMTACALTTASGGAGGKGGDAQNGQGGGARGLGGSCAGGKGGNGAGGSGGAGGTQGISVRILYNATGPGGVPTWDSMTTFGTGSAGLGGAGGALGLHGSGALTTGNNGVVGAGGFTDGSASGNTLGI